MILYLAGLKALDPSLREAAAIDGASECARFFRVVLPALKPINIVLVVITVIEALRAFDIVYIINRGRNGLELLSVLITDNIVGEASRIGYGSAIAVDPADDLDRPDRDLRLEQLPGVARHDERNRRAAQRRVARSGARTSTFARRSARVSGRDGPALDVADPVGVLHRDAAVRRHGRSTAMSRGRSTSTSRTSRTRTRSPTCCTTSGTR